MKLPVFKIDEREQEGGVVLALSGELDLAGAPRAHDGARTARRRPAGTLTVDLTDLEFIDSSGLRVLVRLHNAATAADYTYRLIAGPPQVHRAFVLSGLDQALPFAGSHLPVRNP